MYTWVSSEIWLILAVISLIIFLTKGIDYNQNVFLKRNRMIVMLVPVSICQLIVSFCEIFGICPILRKDIIHILTIYAIVVCGYIFYDNIKNKNTRTMSIVRLLILLLMVILIIVLKQYR